MCHTRVRNNGINQRKHRVSSGHWTSLDCRISCILSACSTDLTHPHRRPHPARPWHRGLIRRRNMAMVIIPLTRSTGRLKMWTSINCSDESVVALLLRRRACCRCYGRAVTSVGSAMGLPHVERTGNVQRCREFINRQSSLGRHGWGQSGIAAVIKLSAGSVVE